MISPLWKCNLSQWKPLAFSVNLVIHVSTSQIVESIMKGNASVYWQLQCLPNILREKILEYILPNKFRTLKLEHQLVTFDQFHTKRTFPVDADSFNLPIKCHHWLGYCYL